MSVEDLAGGEGGGLEDESEGPFHASQANMVY
jgi:hypothetical protein